MTQEDALFNWLQIQIVAEARPQDRSAQDTAAFFRQILQEDHQVEDLTYAREQEWYILSGRTGEEAWVKRYSAEAVEALLIAIESEPRFNL
mgnify:CR=1 FL=1